MIVFRAPQLFSLAGKPRLYVLEWNMSWLLEVPSIRGVKMSFGKENLQHFIYAEKKKLMS